MQFKISGMHCESCAKIIKINIEEISGVGEIKIDVKGGTASVGADASVKPADVLAKIKEAGYDAGVI